MKLKTFALSSAAALALIVDFRLEVSRFSE
jgi:hypothetical protein